MSVKLTDVAKQAGVSPTTVSRVINNYGSLSQKTIDKVKKAMRELDYYPNSMARSLQGKKNQLIGLIFPTVANPFYGELINLLEEKLFNMGYKTILCNSASDREKEKNYLSMLSANKVDGIIAGAHNLEIDEYQKLNMPIISFDRSLADTIPIVSSDNYRGGYLAAEYLYQQGARQIGIVTGSQNSDSPSNDRLDGYLDYLKTRGLEPHVFKVGAISQNLTLKRIELEKLLDHENLDGIFCTDDLTALMIYNLCKERNISVPDDLKLIGYDGTAFIKDFCPYFPTIEQPIKDIASILIDLLIKRINDVDAPLDKKYVLPVRVHYPELN